MTYAFKTRLELARHLRALCELSCSMSNCSYPIRDFEIDLPQIMRHCCTLKYLYNAYSLRNTKIYIGFLTTGFESSTIFNHFESRIITFQSSLISCYTIRYDKGYYILEQFEI